MLAPRVNLHRFYGSTEEATEVQSYLMSSPSVTVDPVTAMLIVAGVQRGLKMLGFRVEEKGLLDVPTDDALVLLLGPGWERLRWLDVFVRLQEGLERREDYRSVDLTTQATGDVGSWFSKPSPLLIGGLLLGGYFLFFRKRRR